MQRLPVASIVDKTIKLKRFPSLVVLHVYIDVIV